MGPCLGSRTGWKVGAGARGLGEMQVAEESRLMEETRGVEEARLAQESRLMEDRPGLGSRVERAGAGRGMGW